MSSEFAAQKQLRVLIVHYGEDVPTTMGYRPLRYGRLAADLTKGGVAVTRLVPSFSHSTLSQRPSGRSHDENEGVIDVVPTSSYTKARSLRRIRFLRGFQSQLREYLENENEGGFDLVLVGVPPYGLVSSAVGATTGTVVADIRDLWPENLSGSRPPFNHVVSCLMPKAKKRRSALLTQADHLIGLSSRMLTEGAPASEGTVLPLSVDPAIASESIGYSKPRPPGLQACFVGSLNNHFLVEDMLRGWSAFSSEASNSEVSLTIAGYGPLQNLVMSAAELDPTIKYLGRVPSDEVAGILADSDVGMLPTSATLGYSMSNKALEYAAAGVAVVHSLKPGPANDLARIAAAYPMRNAETDVLPTLSRVSSDLATLRSGRLDRISRAFELSGGQLLADAIIELARGAREGNER